MEDESNKSVALYLTYPVMIVGKRTFQTQEKSSVSLTP